MSTTPIHTDTPPGGAMRCEQAQRLITNLKVGEPLPAPLAAHLAGCRQCAAEYDADMAAKRLVQAAPWPAPGIARNRDRRAVPGARSEPRAGGGPAGWRWPGGTVAMPGWPWAVLTTLIAAAAVWIGVQVAERGWRLGIGGEMTFAGSAGGQFQVCVRHRDGRVRIIDAGNVCERGETALAANAGTAASVFGVAGGDYRAGTATIKAGTSFVFVYLTNPLASSDYRVAVIPTSGAIFAPDGACRYLNVSAKTSEHFGIDVRKCHSASHADQSDPVAEDLDLDWIAVLSR